MTAAHNPAARNPLAALWWGPRGINFGLMAFFYATLHMFTWVTLVSFFVLFRTGSSELDPSGPFVLILFVAWASIRFGPRATTDTSAVLAAAMRAAI